jgi:hypothetical protein
MSPKTPASVYLANKITTVTFKEKAVHEQFIRSFSFQKKL